MKESVCKEKTMRKLDSWTVGQVGQAHIINSNYYN